MSVDATSEPAKPSDLRGFGLENAGSVAPALPSAQALPGWSLAVAYTLVACLLVAPLLLTAVPPLLDYPNHLARAQIMSTLESDPWLKTFYQIHYAPIPNLAGDLLIPLLAKLVDIYTAGKIFLALCLLSTLAGVAVLHRELFGRWHWWPLVSGLFASHGAFQAGFINFSLGLGLAFLFAAAWIALVQRRLWIRITAASAFCLVLYFSHLLALGICALLVASHSFVALRQTMKRGDWKKFALVEASCLFLPFILPTAFFVHRMAESGDLFGDWTIFTRLRGLFFPLQTSNTLFDIALLIVTVGLLFGLARARQITLAKPMLPALGMFGAMFLVLPDDVLQTAYVTERLPIAAALLFIASSTPTRIETLKLTCTAAVFVALISVRQGYIAYTWSDFDDFAAEILAASNRIEQGSVVEAATVQNRIPFLSLTERLDKPGWWYSLGNFPNLMHMHALTVIERSSFVPMLFSHPEKQPLSVAESLRHLDRAQGAPLDVMGFIVTDSNGRLRLDPALHEIDYVFVFYPELWDDRHLLSLDEVRLLHQSERLILLGLH